MEERGEKTMVRKRENPIPHQYQSQRTHLQGLHLAQLCWESANKVIAGQVHFLVQ